VNPAESRLSSQAENIQSIVSEVPQVLSDRPLMPPVATVDVNQGTTDTVRAFGDDGSGMPYDTSRYFDTFDAPSDEIVSRWTPIANWSVTTLTGVDQRSAVEPISALFAAADPNLLKAYARWYKYFQSGVEIRVTIAPSVASSCVVVFCRENYVAATPGVPNSNACSFDTSPVFQMIGSASSFTRIMPFQDVGINLVSAAATVRCVGTFSMTQLTSLVTNSNQAVSVPILVEARLHNPRFMAPVAVASLALSIQDHGKDDDPATTTQVREAKKSNGSMLPAKSGKITNGWDFGTSVVNRVGDIVEKFAPMALKFFLNNPDLAVRTFNTPTRAPQFYVKGTNDCLPAGTRTDYYVPPLEGIPAQTDFFNYANWGLIAKYTFLSTDTAVTNAVVVCPNAAYTSTGHTHPSAAYTVSSFFQKWRGTMHYRFLISAPAGVSGKFRICRSYAALPVISSSIWSILENTVVPFNGDTMVTIDCPFRCSSAYDSLATGGETLLNIVLESAFTQSGAAASSVNVVLLSRMGRDMEFIMPVSLSNTLAFVSASPVLEASPGLSASTAPRPRVQYDGAVRARKKAVEEVRKLIPSELVVSLPKSEIEDHCTSYFTYNNWYDILRRGSLATPAANWASGYLPAMPPILQSIFWFYRGSFRIDHGSGWNPVFDNVLGHNIYQSGRYAIPYNHSVPMVDSTYSSGLAGDATFTTVEYTVIAPGDDAMFAVPITPQAA
jgi:hypothetical protein